MKKPTQVWGGGPAVLPKKKPKDQPVREPIKTNPMAEQRKNMRDLYGKKK